MLRSGLFRTLLATTSFIAATAAVAGLGQNASQQYKTAEAILKSHTAPDDILNDSSHDAYAALTKVWNAAAHAVIEVLASDGNATPQEIDKHLCEESIAAAGCDDGFSPKHDVLQLGKNLYVVAVATNNGGTVFVIGEQSGKPAQLWALAKAAVTRKQDPLDLIGAWLPDRTGVACREEASLHKPGSCGPLYSELGLLPRDSQGRPRFFIDAGYEQIMGATIGKQTSIWRWDGDHAELLWIAFYSYMIDQSPGTYFDDDKGTLHVEQKGEFKTMFSCGSCVDRPLDQSVLLTATGLQDLGVRSLAPELDRIDDLFSRLQSGHSADGIATPQVVSFLTRGIEEAKQNSNKIDPHWFSVGMIDSSAVQLTSTGANLCIEPDSEFGTLHFTLRRTTDGGYFIEHVASAPANAECPRGSFLPEMPSESPTKN